MSRAGQGYHTISSRIPHLGLQVLAQCTPAGHQVDIYDEIFGPIDVLESLAQKNYDLIGVTAMTSGAARAYELARDCRAIKKPVIFGGIHATTCPDEAQPHFDSVVIGEADELWPEILADVQARRLQPRYTAGRLPDLSNGVGKALQTISPINGRYDVASLQTSRGCPTGCKFCSVTKVNGPKIRRRAIDSIVDEWNSVNKSFVFIVDDNFFGLSEKQALWAKDLCRALIERGKRHLWFSQTTINMGDDKEALDLAYQAGCRGMLVGIESFEDESLQDFQKRLNRQNLSRYRELIDGFHRSGIAVFGGFIFGSDSDTPQSLEKLAVTAVQLGVDIIQVTNLTPLPGTDLYEEFKREGRLLANRYPDDWEKYTFTNTVFKPKKMTAQELDEAMFLFRRGALERRWILKRTLKTLFKTRSLTTAIFVHGMNKGFLELAKIQVPADTPKFPHLKNVPSLVFPD
jgi:radical SAM superfamily enzyme YgiQ (UPF0313 family)